MFCAGGLQARKLWDLLEKKHALGDFSHTFGALDPVQVNNQVVLRRNKNFRYHTTFVGDKSSIRYGMVRYGTCFPPPVCHLSSSLHACLPKGMHPWF